MKKEAIFKQFDKPFSSDCLNEINKVFTHYIFYSRTSRHPTASYDCFCSYCNKRYTAGFSTICEDGYTLKHRDPARCPECNHTGTLYHENKGRKTLEEWKNVIVWKKTDHNHVYAQGLSIRKSFINIEECYEELEYYESVRYLFTPGEVRIFKRHFYYGTYGWYEPKSKMIEPFPSGFTGHKDYYFINDSVLDNTFMKYSRPIKYISKHNGAWLMKDMKYMCWYVMHPSTEMFIKLGLIDFVKDALSGKPHKRHINWDGKTPTEAFKKLSAHEFREFLKTDKKCDLYESYVKLREHTKKVSFREMYELQQLVGSWTSRTLYELLEHHQISLTQAINYIKKQNIDRLSEAIFAWRDYLKQAEQLNYDMENKQVICPKNLFEAHTTATAILNQMKTDIEKKEMKELTKKLKDKYSFEFENLIIKVPESMQEIIYEGKMLQHCVGGYAERHAKGKVIILFVRKKSEPDVPYFTIEIGQRKTVEGKIIDHIVQCHGFKNEFINGKMVPKPEEILNFQKEFADFIADPKLYRKKLKAMLKEAV